MKKIACLFSVHCVLFAVFAVIIFLAGSARAQTTVFTYQGKLTDGGAAPTGQYDLQFNLYDQLSGANAALNAIPFVVENAQVTNGVFTVQLNFATTANAFNGMERWLEIGVRPGTSMGAFSVLTPRQQITSSPFAIRTQTAALADGLSNLCVLCITNAQISGIDGSKVSGAVANATNAATATTAGNVTGIVQIANGGTASSTQNFVDLSTTQIVAGAKTFSDSSNIFTGNGTGLTGILPGNISSGTANININGISAKAAIATSGATPSVANLTMLVLNYGSSTGANRWLEIAVKRASDPPATLYTPLAPRQQITSSPYSIRTLSAAAADSLSAMCAGCVSDEQLGSISGAKVTGTVANAANATSATTAGNVTGVVAIANGGTGSSTKDFVDLTTAQTVAGDKTFSGATTVFSGAGGVTLNPNVRNNGLFRGGNETGTTESPAITSGTYAGLVTRRINSTSQTAGQVIARTDTITFERDGTDGGFRVSYPAGASRSVHCLGVSNTGAVIGSRILIPQSAGTSPVYTDAQNIEFLQCSFGSTFNNNSHVTQITLERFLGDIFWVGTVTSTFNQ